MRIALLQVHVRPGAGSANLAHVLRRIVLAAELIPPPDVLLLPGWCDGHEGGAASEATVQGFSESLAAAAREWGVYLAAGSLRADGQSFSQCARLYDPDGDVVARSGGPGSCPVADLALGRLAVCLDSPEASADCTPPACDMLLLLGRWARDQRPSQGGVRCPETRLGQLARRIGAVVCAAGPVTDAGVGGRPPCIGGTAAYAPDGRCLVAAADGAEETVVAEVSWPIRDQVVRPPQA